MVEGEKILFKECDIIKTMSVKNFFDIHFFKFILVGIINTIIGSAVMFLLYNLAGCSYWISSICNYIVGGICSYLLNKYFTFKNTQKSLKQILLFIFNLIICYLIAYIGAKYVIYKIFDSLTLKIKDNIAMATGMILYTGLNYLTQRYIIFSKNEDQKDEKHTK